MLGLGDMLASRVGVEEFAIVAVGLGVGVDEGGRDRVWDTCASTVAATSVRTGFKSRVGVLVGAEVVQADNQSRLRNTPNKPIVFVVCII